MRLGTSGCDGCHIVRKCIDWDDGVHSGLGSGAGVANSSTPGGLLLDWGDVPNTFDRSPVDLMALNIEGI